MKKFMLLLICCLFPIIAFAQTGSNDLTIIPVGEASNETEKFYLVEVDSSARLNGAIGSAYEETLEVIRNDFSFYKSHFNLLKATEKLTTDSIDYNAWKVKGAALIVLIKAEPLGTGMIDGKETLRVNVKASRVNSKQEFFNQTYSIQVKHENLRRAIHRIADELYRSITGKASVFTSSIVFVSDKSTPECRRRKKDQREICKELFMMDFDGRNMEQLTAHDSVVISPAFSPDNKKVIYSVMRGGKGQRNLDLFLLDIDSKKSELISDRKGINSGAIFEKDGEHIIFTTTQTGNADIFRMNIKTKEMKRLTTSSSDDVDPSLAADGETMAFLSGRAGKAMAYVMKSIKLDNPDNAANVKRVTFTGQFNATPRLSADGKQIVFSSWVDRSFDIYSIDTEGTNLTRLTKDFGMNEDPSFSQDGELIIFTSTRTLSSRGAHQNVYIMDKNGDILGPLTKEMGNCLSPRWSN